jgi:PAS domain S-box-containing protein
MIKGLTFSSQGATGIWGKFNRPLFFMTAVCLVGVAFSLLVFFSSRSQELEGLAADFNRLSQDHGERFQAQITSTVGVVGALGAALAIKNSITSHWFHAFSGYFSAEFPNIQALQWLPLVSRERRAEFERAASRELGRPFVITERSERGALVPAGDRPEYLPVYLLEPLAGNEKALGYDVASDSVGRAALNKARATGRITASASITLAQETKDKVGVLVFFPVFENWSSPQKPAEKRGPLRGVALGVFRVDNLMASVTAHRHSQDMYFSLTEELADGRLRILADSWGRSGVLSDRPFPGRQAALPEAHGEVMIQVADRMWRLHCLPTPRFVAANISILSWALLAAGLLVTSLVMMILWVMARHGRQLTAVNQRLSEELWEREAAEAAATASEARYRDIFNLAPISLLELDLSPIKQRLEELQRTGDHDLGEYLAIHPEALAHCASLAQVEDFNKHSMGIFRIHDKKGLSAAVTGLLASGPLEGFCQALALPDVSEKSFQCETAVHIGDGSELHLDVRMFVPAEYTTNWRKVLVAMHDITYRRQAETAIRESEQIFRATFEQAAVAMAQVALDGSWLRVNQRLCDIVGYTEAELLNLSFQDITPPDDLEHDLGYVQKLLDGTSKTYSIEKRYIRKDRSIVWTNLTIALVRSIEQNPDYFVSVVEDISARKAAESEVQRLHAELEQRVATRTAELQTANAELESFAYSVSHDLRSPLRALDGLSQAVLEDYGHRLDDQGRQYLERIRAASQRMGRLIDDILKLSRVTRSEFKTANADLSRMAGDIMEYLQSAEPQRSVEVLIQPGLTAQGDVRLLRVVMQNLLDNAWKFTSKQASARIEFLQIAIQGDETAFMVRDNGAGFDMEYAGKLFGAFQRLHSHNEYPGTGVGLATVARIVRRHRGKIWAESSEGHGASFNFTLGGEAWNNAKENSSF